MPVDKAKPLTGKCLHDSEHSGSTVKQTDGGSREDPTVKDICGMGLRSRDLPDKTGNPCLLRKKRKHELQV